jgi:hypothetical protein
MKAVAIMSLLLLAACAPPGAVESLKPVCDALIGPITYNSHNKNSLWHAGPKLAPQIALRNSVGRNLSCPAYK